MKYKEWVQMTPGEKEELLFKNAGERRADGKHVFEKDIDHGWDPSIEGAGSAAKAVEASQAGEDHGDRKYDKEYVNGQDAVTTWNPAVEDCCGDEPVRIPSMTAGPGKTALGELGQPGKPGAEMWKISKAEDPSNPSHYKLLSRECIDIIEDFSTAEEFLGLLLPFSYTQ